MMFNPGMSVKIIEALQNAGFSSEYEMQQD